MKIRHMETAAKLMAPKPRVHNPAPGRTLRQWAVDRTNHGHSADCNRGWDDTKCDCSYGVAYDACFTRGTL